MNGPRGFYGWRLAMLRGAVIGTGVAVLTYLIQGPLWFLGLGWWGFRALLDLVCPPNIPLVMFGLVAWPVFATLAPLAIVLNGLLYAAVYVAWHRSMGMTSRWRVGVMAVGTAWLGFLAWFYFVPVRWR